MKIPKTIYIKGKKWRVRRKKVVTASGGERCFGTTDTDNKIIEIRADLEGNELKYVFWHEFAHAVLWESGATVHEGGIPIFVEETICDALGDVLSRDLNVSFKRSKKK